MRGVFLALFVAVALAFPGGVYAAEEGTISVPLKEYERLKELEEGDKRKQYWKMSFEQILEKENNNYSKAWELYEFWVLRTIYLDGNVSSGVVGKLVGQIQTLNQISRTEPIEIVIRSGGGGVLEGLALVNAMIASTAPVDTTCDSYAFSMAAVVFITGRNRIASEGCLFMIHEVAVGSQGGQTTDHVKWTETVIDVEAQLVRIMSRRTGLSDQEIRTLMEYETFWDADEMIRLGFANINVRGLIGTVPERDIPEDLLPLNRMKKNFNEKLTR